MGFSKDDSKAKVAEEFGLELAEVEKYMEKYWN